MLEGVSSEICNSMQAASQSGQMEDRLGNGRLRRVESAIAKGSQSGTARAGLGQLGH